MQTGQNTFIGLNMPKYAFSFAVFRKILLVIPLVILLPRIGFGVDGVFFAESCSEVIAGTVCYITMLYTVIPMIRREKALPVKEPGCPV